MFSSSIFCFHKCRTAGLLTLAVVLSLLSVLFYCVCHFCPLQLPDDTLVECRGSQTLICSYVHAACHPVWMCRLIKCWMSNDRIMRMRLPRIEPLISSSTVGLAVLGPDILGLMQKGNVRLNLKCFWIWPERESGQKNEISPICNSLCQWKESHPLDSHKIKNKIKNKKDHIIYSQFASIPILLRVATNRNNPLLTFCIFKHLAIRSYLKMNILFYLKLNIFCE